MIKPWTTVSSKKLGDFRVFSVRSVERRPPDGGPGREFFIIDSVNWVNVIATTPDRRIILVEQYRHGSDTVELEIPGGMMDRADAGPEATAMRELREETGYTGEKARIIGHVFPNPAIMSNICHTVLVENCRLTDSTDFDETEDLATKLVPIDDATRLVESGKIRHALVVAALFHFQLWRGAYKA